MLVFLGCDGVRPRPQQGRDAMGRYQRWPARTRAMKFERGANLKTEIEERRRSVSSRQRKHRVRYFVVENDSEARS